MVNIGIGIVRTKAMAVLLGPAGFGLMGVYGSIADLALSIAGMGINSSGVRQIAEAVGSGETERIARTVAVLRRTSIVLGILGAVLLVVFSRQVSTLTFGSDQHAAAVALLSLAVFFRLVSGGQGALIQGMRRISDLARMGVLGALFGTMISIPVVYFLREEGVVPSLVGVAAMSILTSWWYSRKVQIPAACDDGVPSQAGSGPLLKLGFAFMASGFLMMGAAYAVRIIVAPQSRLRSGRILSICLDSGRTVCRVHSAGHGSRLLSPLDGRRQGQCRVQPPGERAGAGQPVVGGTGCDSHPDFCAAGDRLVL